MKKVSQILLAGSSVLIAVGTAFAMTLPDGTVLEELTGDDRWGCEVLLCLANPNGPRAVAECRPPIDKLFKCLSKRHPCKFPKCPVAGDGNEAKQVDNSFDPCAMFGGDYQEAPRGFLAKPYKEGDSTADMGKYEIRTAGKKGYTGTRYNYNGEIRISDDEGGYEWGGSKACVRGSPKKVTERISCNDDDSWGYCTRTVYVYDDILWQEPKSRRAIDVYIDGQLWNRVHW